MREMVALAGRKGERGRISRALLIAGLCFLLAWWGFTYLVALSMGLFRHSYLQVTLPTGDTRWFEFRRAHMRTADRAADLERADWLPSEGGAWGEVEFARVELPLAIEAGRQEWRADQATLTVYGDARVRAEWSLAGEDSEGVSWQLGASAQLEGARQIHHAPQNRIGPLRQPSLKLDAQARRADGGREISVAVELSGGETGALTVDDITRDGRPVPVRVRVVDEAGKVVASEEGPLDDFGYT